MNLRSLFSRQALWLGYWLLAGGIGVVAYNTWSLCCGACSVENLLSFNGPVILLLAANLVALLALAILKRLNRLKFQTEICSCGWELQPGWSSCPRCGKERP